MHRVIETNLESYLDGSLLPVRRREVDSHLEACELCRQEMAEALETHEWLQALVPDKTLAPAPGFYSRVRSRISAESARPMWPFWQLFPALGRQLAYAAVLFAILLGAYVVALQHTERGGGGEAAEMSLEPQVMRAETPALTGDNYANRERVMRAIVMPVSTAQGD